MSEAEVLNFRTIGDGEVGEITGDVTNLTNINIPTKLPKLDENVLNILDADAVIPLLHNLNTLLNSVPRLPMRPAIDFTKNADFIPQLDKMTNDFINSINQYNNETAVQRQDVLQRSLDGHMTKVLQNIQASQPSPPPPPPPNIFPMPYGFCPTYQYFPPPFIYPQMLPGMNNSERKEDEKNGMREQRQSGASSSSQAQGVDASNLTGTAW